MQGTIVMLMAMSGLGCHHNNCAPAAVSYASCYGSSGCYSSCYSLVSAQSYTTYVAPACYSAGYASCYSGCYGSACYGGCYGGVSYGGCYGGRKHHHGLFGCKR